MRGASNALGPIPLLDPPSRWAIRVAALDPGPAPAGPVPRPFPLRDHTLEAEPAGVMEHQGAVLLGVLDQSNAVTAPQEQRELRLALLEWLVAQVLAVEFK